MYLQKLAFRQWCNLWNWDRQVNWNAVKWQNRWWNQWYTGLYCWSWRRLVVLLDKTTLPSKDHRTHQLRCYFSRCRCYCCRCYRCFRRRWWRLCSCSHFSIRNVSVSRSFVRVNRFHRFDLIWSLVGPCE